MKQIDAAFRRILENLRADARMVVALIGTLFVLDGFIFVRGQLLPTARAFARANQLKKQIHQAEADIKSSAAYRKNVEESRKTLVSLEKKMTTDEELLDAMESISKFADISTVRLLRIKPLGGAEAPGAAGRGGETTVSAEGLSRRRIMVMLKAGFHQLGRFVALLENSGVFMDIQKLEIQADESEYMKQSVTILLDVVVKKV